MNFDELKLIFLLHDLGMFYQRTGLSPSDTYKDLSSDDLRYAHSKWSASLAEEMGLSKDIQEVILYHHKPESLEGESYTIAKILSKASEHFVDKEAPEAASLLSVFSRVQITTDKVPQNYFIPCKNWILVLSNARIEKIGTKIKKPMSDSGMILKTSWQN